MELNHSIAQRKQSLKGFSKIQLHKTFFHILTEWTIIIGVVLFYKKYTSIAVWIIPVLIILIGTRMYALYSILHDGLHFLLFKNKKFNDWISKIFLSTPLFISLDTMRDAHYRHHKHLSTDSDPEFQLSNYPEFQFPLPKWKFFKIVVLDLTGFNFVRYKWLRLKRMYAQKGLIGLLDMFYSTLLLLCMLYITYWLGLLDAFILLWLLPYVTVFMLLSRLRAYTEHFNLPQGVQTRSLLINSVAAFFISPYNLGYHEVHHKYPFVPRYNLRLLHKWEKENSKIPMYEEYSVLKMLKMIFSNKS